MSEFVKFIDQYPTNILSIDILESQIIDYYDNNKIEYDEFMRKICIKYQLKNMYIHIHNKDLKLLSRFFELQQQILLMCKYYQIN